MAQLVLNDIGLETAEKLYFNSSDEEPPYSWLLGRS